MISAIIEKFRFKRFKNKWRAANKHNETFPVSYFPLELAHVGRSSYGELHIVTFNPHSHLHIGNYVSIAQRVSFLLDVEHRTDYISTFPFKKKLLDGPDEAFSKGDIIVDDDVWIGYGATILSGVHIHQGAVIAAGAVVTKGVPPYAIVGGVPATIIRFRFDQEIIEKMLKIDYSKIDDEYIRKNVDKFYQQLDNNASLEFLPQRS